MVLETPPKQPIQINKERKSPLIFSGGSNDNLGEQVLVPYSRILEDTASYSPTEISRERTVVIRVCMDSLISISKGRPSEVDILKLAKSIASKYPCLRDKPEEPLRDNYVNLL